MSENRNLILALAAILLAPSFSRTGVSKTLFDGMTWYHSADPADRLSINEHGHLGHTYAQCPTLPQGGSGPGKTAVWIFGFSDRARRVLSFGKT